MKIGKEKNVHTPKTASHTIAVIKTILKEKALAQANLPAPDPQPRPKKRKEL